MLSFDGALIVVTMSLMDIPYKPKKPQQINVRVEDTDIEVRETLKARGIDVAELYRRAIRRAHALALKNHKAC